LRSYVDVGLVSAFLLALTTATAPQPQLRIDIVFEGRPMSHARAASAATEVRVIWARYGVDVRVASTVTETRADALSLRVTLADHANPRLSREALGSINFQDGSPIPFIVLYPARVEEEVSMAISGHANEYPEARLEHIVGRVLGRALAPEIGHFLLRKREHSGRGLMQARQLVPDLMLEDRRCCSLTSADVVALEDRIAAAAGSYLDLREYAISTPFHSGTAPKDR
jgi:hypothetical protein